MSKVGDTKNQTQPVNNPKNYDPKAYIKAWRGPSGKIFPIDMAWLVNCREVLEKIDDIHKTTINAIHRGWKALSSAILNPSGQYRQLVFAIPYDQLNTPNLYGGFKTFDVTEDDYIESLEDKCELEWARQQQMGGWYVYGGSIGPNYLSESRFQERWLPRTKYARDGKATRY